MNFELSEDQRMLKETISKMMKKECPPEYVRECDENERYPQEIFDKMAAIGLMGLPFPEKYGGTGGSNVDLLIAIEEIGRHMLAAAQIYGGSVVFGGQSILEYGNEDQKIRFLPPLCKGEIQFSLALTEPNAGSDAASVQTIGEKKGDRYVINGSKIFISRAQHAEWMIVVTKTDRTAPRYKGLTVFLVDTKSKGITMKKIRKMGNRCTDTNEIHFEDVEVPEENILGSVNQGWNDLLKTLEKERAYLAAFCVGGLQSVVTDCIRYANERVQFGKSIGSFQLIKEKISNMQVDLDAARLLTYWAGWLADQGLPSSREAAEAKLFASEAYMRGASQGVQIFGGYGYCMEFDMQRHFRDAKLMEIGGGTSEIQRLLIASQLMS